MKPANFFSFTATVVLTVLVFAGADTASAAHEAVLCEELKIGDELCSDDKLVAVGTVFRALASNMELTAGAFSKVKCEDLTLEGKVTSAMPLKASIMALEFGKLPTPSLGVGCTTCVSGLHTVVPVGTAVIMKMASTTRNIRFNLQS